RSLHLTKKNRKNGLRKWCEKQGADCLTKKKREQRESLILMWRNRNDVVSGRVFKKKLQKSLKTMPLN
ncbi:unnamed protein product, partial [Ilex paraguariensis]